MESCNVLDILPTPSQYNHLRQSVGWGTCREEAIAGALPRSLYGVCAFVQDEIVGMARIIGDGGLVYYIQDVIVLPAYQGRDIGTQMMDRVMDYIRAHAGPHAVIGLMAARGKEAFYERYGFTRRPNERLGAGMTVFWKG